MSSPPSLAAALIVKNEARCIVRCLESVRHWVDRVVVVDTGSSDDTVARAMAHGAEVHEVAWRDDFAAARNQALAFADADWTLMIDGDEWIESGADQLRGWIAGGGERLGVVCIHSSFDAAGDVPEARSWITRLLPRGARFEGRVHEQVVSALPRERIELHLGHDGYRDAQLEAKRARNRPLLLKELEARPEDPYLLYQLGTDAEGRDAFDEAADWYARAHALTGAAANWRHELVVRYLHSLGQAGRGDEAMMVAEVEMPHWPESPDFFFVLGNLVLDRAMADPGNALEQWLPLAISAWERCLAIGERPDLEGSVAGRGSHLAQRNLDAIQSQLG